MFACFEKDGLLHIEVSGSVDADEMQKGLDAFLALAEGREKIRCVYVVRDVELPTFQAIMVEFGYFGRLISLLPKMDRVALVANQSWVEQMAAVESMMIPGLEIRSYESAEAAMTWLKGGL